MKITDQIPALSAQTCERACQYALDMLASKLPPRMYYHSMRHTVDEVLPQALHIAHTLNLDSTTLRLLKTAVCFHDTGFTMQRAWHEKASISIARTVLPDFGFTTPHVEAITHMIAGTELPQSPDSLPAQILADADLDLLGRSDFLQRNLDLRLELTACGVHMSDAEWYATQLDFIANHRYFTPKACSMRAEGKQNNIDKLTEIVEGLPVPVCACPMPNFKQFGIPISRHYIP